MMGLLERVEAAAAGSRELDKALMVLVPEPVKPLDPHWIYALGGTAIPMEWVDNGYFDPWPVTASIDAALALVERMLPGATWTHDMDAEGRDGSHVIGLAWRENETADWIIEEARAATVPLAVVAALLRALRAMTPFLYLPLPKPAMSGK